MRSLIAALVIAPGLAACSGISTSSDWDGSYDFGRLASYAWSEQGLEGGVSEIMLRRMRLAVGEQLAAKGFVEAEPDRADFLLAYHAGVQNRQQYDTYGYGAGGWWGGYWGGGMTTTTVRSYSEGTLILDVVDRASNQLVWRGTASGTIDAMEGPEQRIATIEEAVRKMLKEFPPN